MTTDYLEKRIAFNMEAIPITLSDVYEDRLMIGKHQDKSKSSFIDNRNRLKEHVDIKNLMKLDEMRRKL